MSVKRKTKVLVPVRYPVGGIRSYIKYTYRNLTPGKYEFTILGTEHKWLSLIKEDLHGMDVEIVVAHNNLKSMAKGIFSTMRRSRYDLIHSQGYTAGVLGCFINVVFRIPHLITLHHVFNADQFSDTFWDKYGGMKRVFIERILSKADIIQCVSRDAQENFLAQFPSFLRRMDNLSTIYNGININAFMDDNGSDDCLDVKEDGKFILGFLGRYMPEKGFGYIIDAIDLLVKKKGVTDIKVVTVGGFGGFIREFKKELGKREIQEYFDFRDFTTNVRKYLIQFDVLLVPSLGEACPLVPMEALICGTPVIAFSSIGLRDVLRDTPAIMVERKNVGALVEAIIEYLRHKREWKKKFREYIPTATERFDVRHTARQLESAYVSLLNRKKQ
jgi:glycosyltransferase involved in cell wall biosynthesis